VAVIGTEILHSLFVFAVHAQVFVRHAFVQFVVPRNALRASPPFLLRTGLDAEFDILGHLPLQWLFFGSHRVSVQVFAVFIFHVDDGSFFVRLGLVCKCIAYSICLTVFVYHAESHVPFAVIAFQLFCLD